jgi:GC-rich sequence DNA-binding factor
MKNIRDKLKTSRELNHKHYLDIDRISEEFKSINIDLEECTKNGPLAAAKYRYYQEFKMYVEDLVECLNEKLPVINALEDKMLAVTSKYSKMLIERRRQDVRDQAKELTDLKTVKKSQEDEERVRRAAEREGRRTRRRRYREKTNFNESHYEGMSSDDEVPDIELKQYKESLAQIKQEAMLIFDDVSEEYCQLGLILNKFSEWKKKEFNAYKESFFHLCLPKIVIIFIRWHLIMWNPLEKCEGIDSISILQDIDKMEWFHPLAMYSKAENETEESLRNDPDVFLIPTIIEKAILMKLNKIIEGCFDPLSRTQTLRLVQLLNQLSKDYPSLRITSKNLQNLFTTITEKMKLALDNDVFIPIFQKQQ